MTRKEEANLARKEGLKKFKSSKPCQIHPNAYFYTSNVLCIECAKKRQLEQYNPEQRAAYWEKNKAVINNRRKEEYYLKKARVFYKQALHDWNDLEIALALTQRRFDATIQQLEENPNE